MSCDVRDQKLIDGLKSELEAQPLTLAVMPGVRRSAVYVLLAVFLIPLIRWWLHELLPYRGIAHLIFGVITVALVTLGTFGVVRWRLRVDDQGIWRRRLLGWDLWPWEAFAEGRVSEGEDSSTTFIFREKPFWARKMSLELLAEDDQRRILDLIRHVLVRPPEPVLPVELTILFGFRKEAYIARESLLIRNRGEVTRYAWKEIQSLRIRRRYHDRHDFSSLEIVLPDQIITLRLIHQNGQASRSWSGARGSPTPSPAIVAGIFERYVPADRVLVTALREPPRTMAEWQDRRALLEQKGRDLKNLRWILAGTGAFVAFLTLAEFYSNGWSGFKFAILSSVMWGLFWAVLKHIERDHLQSLADIEAQVPGE
jgi:hypothetical protein